MYQLVGAIQKNPQAVGEAVANGAGVGFEDMLQQASQKQGGAAADKKPAQASDSKPADSTGKTDQKAPNAQGAQDSQSAQKPQNPQGTQSQQETQGAQENQGTQLGQNMQAQQEQQALAAALTLGGQQQPVYDLAAEEVDAAIAPVVVVNAVQNEGAALNAGQAGGQAQGEPLLQQNVAADTQTVAPQAEIVPQAAAGQSEQAVLQPAGQQNIEQQPQQGAVQPEVKAAANAENALAGQQGQAEEGSEEAAAAAQTPVFAHSEAVPVKVMEAEQPLEAQADDAAEQLAQKINQALAQGESRVTLNLSPANLGNLTVEISRMADGTLSVILSVITEKAAGLLEKHSGSLQSLLAGNMPGGMVRVEVENRTPDENAQQFLNPEQQEREGQQQPDSQRQRRQDGQQATDFMQQLRLGLISLDE